MERPSIDLLVELAAVTTRDTVIDLATGTGIVPAALARSGAAPSSLIGIDRSPAMLAKAPPLPAGWRMIVGDAVRTGLPESCASLVTCAWLLHLLSTEQQLAALSEIARLLTPDGRAILIVPSGARPRGLARFAAPVSKAIAYRRGLQVLIPIANLPELIHEAGLATTDELTTVDGWPARVVVVQSMIA